MSINRKNLLLVCVCVLTVVNIYTQYTHRAYKYYVENITALREDFDLYRKSVNGDIIRGLFELTNICTSANNVISANNLYDNNISVNTNMPSILFDRFAIVKGKPAAIIDNFAYFVGDKFGCWSITDINPSYVSINDCYFYYNKNHMNMKGLVNGKFNR